MSLRRVMPISPRESSATPEDEVSARRLGQRLWPIPRELKRPRAQSALPCQPPSLAAAPPSPCRAQAKACARRQKKMSARRRFSRTPASRMTSTGAGEGDAWCGPGRLRDTLTDADIRFRTSRRVDVVVMLNARSPPALAFSVCLKSLCWRAMMKHR